MIVVAACSSGDASVVPAMDAAVGAIVDASAGTDASRSSHGLRRTMRLVAFWSIAVSVLLTLMACPKPAERSPTVQPASSSGGMAPSAAARPRAADGPVELEPATPVAPDAARAAESDATAGLPADPRAFIVSDAGTNVGAISLAVPCVDPSRHVAVTEAGDSGEVPENAYSTPLEDSDLDGDGTNDLVLAGGASRWDVEYWIYLKRGSCGHFVGRVGSSSGLEVLSSRTKGLADLKVVTDECKSLGGVGHGWCEIVWRFNGVKYAAGREKRSARPARSMP